MQGQRRKGGPESQGGGGCRQGIWEGRNIWGIRRNSNTKLILYAVSIESCSWESNDDRLFVSSGKLVLQSTNDVVNFWSCKGRVRLAANGDNVCVLGGVDDTAAAC
jgi:hypothetical protein